MLPAAELSPNTSVLACGLQVEVEVHSADDIARQHKDVSRRFGKAVADGGSTA